MRLNNIRTVFALPGRTGILRSATLALWSLCSCLSLASCEVGRDLESEKVLTLPAVSEESLSLEQKTQFERLKQQSRLNHIQLAAAQSTPGVPAQEPARAVDVTAKKAIIIHGGTIFDSLNGTMIPGQTIIVRDQKIELVGPQDSTATVTVGAEIIDASGKFIIPGLIDAHIHLAHQLNLAHMTGDEILPMFMAAGVTSLRDVGDCVWSEKMIARYAEAHPGSCPRVFMCSPLIDGEEAFHRDIGWSLPNPDDVPAFVEDMAEWGVTTLKIYVGTKRPVGQRVIEEGHKHGLMITGHLGLYSAQDAVADGIDCLEHIWSVFDYVIPDGPRPEGYRARMDFTTPKAQDLINAIVKNKVQVDPTLTIFRNAILMTDLKEVHENPDLAHAPKRLQDRFQEHWKNQGLKPETFDVRKGEFQKYQELTGILYRAGATILAGTDTPEPFVVPGYALLEELERLVESGLPPAAALQAATINNARALKQEANIGSITAGKFADLVILNADPLADIKNTRQIDKVMRGGLIAEPAELLEVVPDE
jgi:hypothetical protein